MADDERLREALVELQDLRDREARLLDEAQTLFDILNTLSAAKTVPEAVTRVIAMTQRALQADAVALLGAADGDRVRVIHSNLPGLDGPGDDAGALPVLSKPRNLVDLSTLPVWSTLASRAPQVRSVLSAPIGLGEGEERGALLAFHADRARFTNSDRQMLLQICTLAQQSLKALELQSRNQLLAAVIDGSSSGFAIADATQAGHPLIFVNKAFETLSGYSSAEVLGQNCRFLNDEPAGAPIRSKLRETVRTNGIGSFVLRNKRKDGTPFWNELSLFPVNGDDGRAEYLVATQADVSQRVQAQEESDLTRRRMSEALLHTDDGFLLLDKDLTVLFSNPRLGHILPAPGHNWQPGTTFEDNVVAHIETIPDSILDQAPDVQRFDPRTLVLKSPQRELALPDGRTLLLRVQRTSEGGFVMSTTDITPLKTTERALRARVAAIDNAPDGIGIADPDGRVVYANPSLCELFGVVSDMHLIGRPWSAKYKADNSETQIAATAKALETDGEARLRLVLGAGDDGRRWHDVVLRRVDGVGVILIVRDVTKQRAIRKKQFELTEQLDLARRQQVISQMAAGLAHDFNNLLSAINGSATLISGDTNATDALKGHAKRIAQAGVQAAYLVNRLLDLGRTTSDVAEFDLREAIRSAVDLLSVNLGPHVTLTSDLGDAPILVRGSPTEVSRIVLNLLLNAQDAMGSTPGTLRIGAAVLTGQSAKPTVGRVDVGKLYATFHVADDGPGIPAGSLTKIFDPYFTTKGAQGSGLGLATVSSMVVSNNGAISVESAPGAGSQFTVFWPLEDTSIDTSGAEEDAAQIDLSGHLILVVDDDADVANVLGTYLENLGAEVAVVNDPDLAIESVRDDPGAWSLVLSDYNMGAISGGDLVEAAAQVAPDLPVMIVTALSRRLADPRLSVPSVKAVFAKPPDLRQISQAVAEHARTKIEKDT
ncbi:MAG: PAS domain-containing protein [Pseudomonadota bacterium]